MSEKNLKKAGRNRLLSPGDLSIFCSQVAMILRAAIPLSDGIAAIGETMESEPAKSLIGQLHSSLEKDGALYPALKKAGVFPGYMVNMVQIGEKAGRLDSVMEALSRHYEREQRLYGRIRGAILYPFILTLMMAVVISILVIKVLPLFGGVFQNMGGGASSVAASVMRAGTDIGVAALVVTALLAVLLLAALLLNRSTAGSRWLSAFLHRFRPVRRIADKVDSARFASVLSMLLSSGYDTTEALELLPGILTGSLIQERVRRCREAMDAGASFPAALESAELFPGLYGSMVQVGAKTGGLDTVMKQLAELYSQDADEAIDKAVAVIEPAMVAVLSIVIGAILLSIMLPLMGIMSSIG